MGPFDGLIQYIKDTTAKASSLPQQVQAITQMNPQQAQDYRGQVNKTLPKIPISPAPAVLPTPKQNSFYGNMMNTMAQFQPTAQSMISKLANPIQTGAEGLARLPAARTLGQGVGDVGDFASGALTGANALHFLTSSGIQPGLTTNSSPLSPEAQVQVKADFRAGKLTPEQFIEQMGGWKPGLRTQFDSALQSKDVATVNKLLPNVPEEYKIRFADEINKVIGGSATSSGQQPQPAAAEGPLSALIEHLRQLSQSHLGY